MCVYLMHLLPILYGPLETLYFRPVRLFVRAAGF